ncbi:MAG: hypothetical protein AAB534_02455 [Patescibacteria group bacterium]
MRKKTYKAKCPHCDPINKHPAHIQERLSNFFFDFKKLLISIENKFKNKFPKFFNHLNKIVFYGSIKTLITIGILREVEIPKKNDFISNRTFVFLAAAKQRGIEVKTFQTFSGRKTNFFSIIINEKKKIFEILPHNNIDYVEMVEFDNKDKFKEILQTNRFPHPDGKSFSNIDQGINFAKQRNFPFVVKPSSSSLSKHITCNIHDIFSLKEAIRIAQIINRDFILEEHVDGLVYRITLVRHKFIACCLREAPNIVGDNIHTIKELIEQKNNHEWRGEPEKKNYTLRKIKLTDKTTSILNSKGFSLESVPEKNQKIYLHDKVILACGADIHDRTDEIHPDNIKMFEKISELCRSPIIGIDFICKDISKSYKEQKSAVIEANSLPYIDMHHYPVSGKPRDVGGAIADYLLSLK